MVVMVVTMAAADDQKLFPEQRPTGPTYPSMGSPGGGRSWRWLGHPHACAPEGRGREHT